MPFGYSFVTTDSLDDVRDRLTRIERVLRNVARAQQQDLESIMSKISEFSDAMAAFFDRQDAAITDLQGDVKFLSDKIAELQNSGSVTPEDQALLDAIQARQALVADKLDALNALTPPVAPPV